MNKNLHSQIEQSTFKDYSENVKVYLKSSNSQGNSYDPYRNTGYTETYQNPLTVKAIVHSLSANSLIIRELGLIENGAIELIVNKRDINLFKICSKVEYEYETYSPYKQALGSRASIKKISLDFYKVVLFRVGN